MSLPRPQNEEALARLVARFAQVLAGAAHPVECDPESGVAFLARDARPGSKGDVWAFQIHVADHLDAGAMDALLAPVERLRRRPEHTVIVTRAPVSEALQAQAQAWTRRLSRAVEIWDWPAFAARLQQVLGPGPWLAEEERRATRQQWCEQVRAQLVDAPAMPLAAQGRCLSEVLIEPRIAVRASQESGPDDGNRHTGTTSAPMVPARDTVAAQLASVARLPAERPIAVLEASAGAGKTVALLHAASELAERAQTEQDDPLPVYLRADALLGPRRDETAMDEVMARGGEDAPLTRLWRDPLSDWIVLIDALDEVPASQRLTMKARLTSLSQHPRVRAVAVATRPEDERLLPGALYMELLPWTEEEQRVWLGQHGVELPAPPARPRSPWAAVLAVVAGTDLRQPGSEVVLLDGLLDQQLRAWSAGARRALERLAWEAIRTGAARFARLRLEQALAGQVEDPGALLDAAMEPAALLRAGPSGTVEAGWRLALDALAARELARRPRAELVDAASASAAHEAARLAILRLAADDRGSVPELIESLLALHEQDTEMRLVRRLGLICRVAVDLGDAITPVAQRLGTHVLVCALREDAAWLRRIGARYVVDLAQARSPVWRAVAEHVLAILAGGGGDRAAWFDSMVGHSPDLRDTPALWSRVIHEEEPAVRALAVRRLGRWVREPGISTFLVEELFDSDYLQRPCVEAGLALRALPRDPASAPLIDILRTILGMGEQFSAGAAALALLPGEAPSTELLAAIREMAKGLIAVPPALRDIVEALCEAEPGARRWLEQHWPDAAEQLANARDPLAEHLERAQVEPLPPCSEAVVTELAKGVAPAFAERAMWERLPAQWRRSPELVEALCRAHATAPERLLPIFHLLLEDADLSWPPAAQDILGMAARRDADLARRLIRTWPEYEQSSRLSSSFPGLALEPLVATGDQQAAGVYAAWLPFCPFLSPLLPYRPPSPDVLDEPVVARAARTMLRRAWERAVEGYEEEPGECVYLAETSLGLLLRGLRPVWREDTRLQREFLSRALADDPAKPGGWFDAALIAWFDSGMPPELGDRLATSLPRSRFELELHLLAAERAGLAGRIEPTLVRIAEQGISESFLAAALLAAHRPRDAYRWSVHAAELWASRLWPWLSLREPLTDARWDRLFAHAPRAWTEQVIASLDRWGPYAILPNLHLLRRLLTHRLPDELRGQALDRLRAQAARELPWRRDLLIYRTRRAGDLAREILYALDQDEIDISGEPAR